MRKKQVWRYYCDHCKRGGCAAGHMKRHEESCTKNPNRTCKMCIYGELIQKPMDELVAALSVSMDELERLCDNCPACILAAIRQTTGELADSVYDFNFKTSRDEFLAHHNKRRQSDNYCYGVY